MKRFLSSLLKLSLSTLGFFCVATKASLAQVTSDGTTNTQVNQNANVAEITGGERRGSNLFHSFQDFSVPTGNEAFFNNNADNISNIFSRVTGGNISNIDGAIRANGSANLFLINPAGIIFGENARLDIGGSFYGSSASSILFEDGEFSAVDNLQQPVLTVNAPIGLGFRDEPGDIINRSSFGLTNRVLDENFSEEFADDNFTAFNTIGLQVNPSQTLALIGGNISLENRAGITAPEGIIELGSLADAGIVNINANGSLGYPDNTTFGNISLNDNSQIEVRGDNGGSININSRNLTFSGKSKIFAGIAEERGSIDSQAGNITINATDFVRLIGSNPSPVGLGTEINNHVGTAPNRRNNSDNASNAIGNGGDIIINTGLLEINEQARITANSYSQGDGGNIILNTDNITINGGAIAGLIVGGVGNAGNIVINNTEDIILNEGSNIQSQVIAEGEGDVGNITIDTRTFAINEKYSFVLADNVSAGNAGNITINASDSIFVDGGGGEDLGQTLSAILSQVQTDVVGDAGDITITTPQLSLTNFALISSNVKENSVGSTGNIFLNVDTLSLDNGSVIDALTENDFDGGSINVDADKVVLSNGGKIVTSGDRGGNAGSININATESIVIKNDNPPLEIPFSEQILQDSASESGLFSSTVAGEGNGGSIDVKAGSIQLESNGLISATTSTGTGGNVSLNVDKTITLNQNSLISAEADTLGNGGNINIDTDFIIAFPNGNNDIVASAEQGNGGNINIEAESLFGIEERALSDLTNDINASSEFSLDGNITINTPDINPAENTTELSTNVIESQETTTQICQANREAAAKNSLTIAGKGGIIAAPDLPLNSQNIFIGEETSSTSVPQAVVTSQGKIQPARGVRVTKSGEVMLTAYHTNNLGQRLAEGEINCGV